MDALESLLETVNLRSTVLFKMELSGDWGLAKPTLGGAPFYVIRSGHLWVRCSAHDNTLLKLAPGDAVILPGGDSHDLMSSPSAELLPFQSLLAKLGWELGSPGRRHKPRVLRYGSGSSISTHGIAGVFGFDDGRGGPLLDALPRILHLPMAATEGWLPSTMDFIEAEISSASPGAGFIASRLADIIFIQAIRAHLASKAPIERGWLRGIGDPRIGPCLALIHSRPEFPWSVAKLAEYATMSRSRFALRFHDLVGRSPLEYLTNVRMSDACRQLASGELTLASLAAKAGYTSEIAFSRAFKRYMGHSPAEFKRRRKKDKD